VESIVQRCVLAQARAEEEPSPVLSEDAQVGCDQIPYAAHWLGFHQGRLVSRQRDLGDHSRWEIANRPGANAHSEVHPGHGTASSSMSAGWAQARPPPLADARRWSTARGVASLKRRSWTLLATTNADDAAMAAPAISGFSSPAAASGIAATL
jgi:hypothetical protein